VTNLLRQEYDDDRWADELLAMTQREGAPPEERVEVWLEADDQDFLTTLTQDSLGWEWDNSHDV
jgi:hypothetical protein